MTVPSPRSADIERYCATYRDLFPDVRSFNAFTALHRGMLSALRRKTLPAIARLVGTNPQSLHHFLSESPWSVREFETRRVVLSRDWLGSDLVLLLAETADPKKGQTTDYVTQQYASYLGRATNSIVAIVAWGLTDEVAVPLLFEVYKPRECLRPGDVHRRKPQIATDLLDRLLAEGFRCQLVLADSVSDSATGTLIRALQTRHLPYIAAIRRRHGTWLAPEQIARRDRWRSPTPPERYWIRELVPREPNSQRFWEVATSPRQRSRWFLVTNAEAIAEEVATLCDFHGWLDYRPKQRQNAAGWADFRVTRYEQIERWWQLAVSSCLFAAARPAASSPRPAPRAPSSRPNEGNWVAKFSDALSRTFAGWRARAIANCCLAAVPCPCAEPGGNGAIARAKCWCCPKAETALCPIPLT